MRAPSLWFVVGSAVAIGLSACGPAENPPVGPGVPTGTPTGTSAGTAGGVLPGGNDFEGYGSIMLVRSETRRNLPPTVELAGIFPTNSPGYTNLAQCARMGRPCLPQLPSVEDQYLDFDPDRKFDGLQFEYSFAGPDITLGPLTAVYQNGNLPFYYANLTSEYGLEGIDGHYGIGLGGDFPDYAGWNDIVVSPAFRMMSHDAGETEEFHDGETLIFEWEPQGEGEVYLTISAGILLNRMFLLEDDGYFELRADDLALGTDEMEVSFSMARWNRAKVDIDGSDVDVVSISEVTWDGLWFYVGGRDLLPAVDTCGEAAAVGDVTSGLYWGRLADWGYADNLDLGFGGSCTGWFSRGQEGVVPFVLPPRTFLTITMTLLTDDASLYLLRNCLDTDSCVAGSDSTYLAGSETVQYFNGSDNEETVYAVFDGYTSTTGLYYADITVNTMGPPDMHDSCTDATNQLVPTPAGGYYSDVTAYTNQLDPVVGGCTATSSPGPEALTKVEVGPGQTITVNVDMAGADPAVYLLYNCSNTNSCAAGSDINVGPVEQVQYTNGNASPEVLYLVVDSKTQMQPWFMTIDIQ